MSNAVIRVEGLGKCYTLNHRQEGQQYKALRDLMAEGAKSIGRRLLGREAQLRADQEAFWALKDVDFEIQQGDRVGIIGRNGAGKSTLLKVLSRIVEPTTGEIRIRGRVASLLEVGTGFHPELTGRENIYLNGAILGMSRAEITRKFDEIVDFAEVEKFLDTPVKRYSSGMYVRLAFAVAAHLEPEILIVDEVLAVGDAQFQKKCLGKMEDVGKEGRTVIFVSHNMSTIQALCSRCLLLQNHSIYSDTTPSSAVRLYLEDNSAKTRFSRQPRSFDKPKFVSGSLHIDDHYNVQVAVQIVSDSARSVCLECQLVDELSVPVAFGDLGTLGSGRLLELSHGTTNVVFQFPGNRLATGNYYLSLDLTMPGIEYFDRAENCLLLEIIRSSQDGSSRVLDQSWGRGSFDLSLQLAQSF